MNVLESRERRIADNDRFLSELQTTIERQAESDAKASLNDPEWVKFRVEQAWWEKSREPVELTCECGNPSCSAKIHATPEYLQRLRAHPELFLCARSHELVEIESGFVLELTGKEHDADFVAARLRNGWDAPVAHDTGKAELEHLEEEWKVDREEINAGLGRLAAALPTGALLLGLFTALRREQVEDLSTILVLLTFVPFAGLVFSSVYVPLRLRRAMRAGRFPGRGNFQRRLEEREARRYKVAVFDRPIEEVFERNRVGLTHESIYRRKAAKEQNPLMGEALLPYEDWVVFRLNQVAWLRYDAANWLDRVWRHEGRAAASLVVLLLYLVWLTTLAGQPTATPTP